MSEAEIREQIAKLKEEKENVKGTPCNVFSRVVGYLTQVQQWNKGKKEEFAMRKLYDVGNGKEMQESANLIHEQNMKTFSSVNK